MSYFLENEKQELFPIIEERTCFVLFSDNVKIKDRYAMEVFKVYEKFTDMTDDLLILQRQNRKFFYREVEFK